MLQPGSASARTTPAATTDETRRTALGAFVRAHRERLSPKAFGLAGGQRRRTPGLRREELADLCGLSTTWITWVEQGRDISLSPAALTRLARVLDLQPAERAYLFELAARRDPQAARDPEGGAPAALLNAVSLIDAPAYVLDRSWTARAWNDAAAELFVGWLDPESLDRNLLHFVLSDEARALIEDHAERLSRLVAEFRADLSRHLEDRAMTDLVRDLLGRSAEFSQAWHQQAVLGREGGLRAFRHPRLGRLAFEQITLVPASRPDFKLVMLTPLAQPASGAPGVSKAQSRSTSTT